jgi:hypothetical protein
MDRVSAASLRAHAGGDSGGCALCVSDRCGAPGPARHRAEALLFCRCSAGSDPDRKRQTAVCELPDRIEAVCTLGADVFLGTAVTGKVYLIQVFPEPRISVTPVCTLSLSLCVCLCLCIDHCFC